MRVLNFIVAWVLIAQLGGAPLAWAQPVIIPPGDPFRGNQAFGNGVENLRLVQQNRAGTESEFSLDYSYDGFAGPIAQVLPVISKRKEKGVTAWFGADPVTVGRGRGTITLKVRFFNDETGVPPTYTTDQIRILILNQSGSAIITAVPFLKTIHWGNAALPQPAAPVAPVAQATPATPTPARPAVAATSPQPAPSSPAPSIPSTAAPAVASIPATPAPQPAPAARPVEAPVAAAASSTPAPAASAEAERRLAETARRLEEIRQRIAARKTEEEKAREERFAKMEHDLKQAAEQKSVVEKAENAALKGVSAQGSAPSVESSQGMKIKVTNVDVVNRSVDRTHLTIGVEFEYKDRLTDPMLGVELLNASDPAARNYFIAPPADIGKSRRNFVLLPVKFQPPANNRESGYMTDQLMVYLLDKSTSRRYNVLPAPMLLTWQAPGAAAALPPSSINTVEIEEFRQHDASTGTLGVRYNLTQGSGRLRVRLYDSAHPDSAGYFVAGSPVVAAGRGAETISVMVNEFSPAGGLESNRVEIQLVDASGAVLARTEREGAMRWMRASN